MKYLLAICLCMMLVLSACGGTADPTTPSTPSTPSNPSNPSTPTNPSDPTQGAKTPAEQVALALTFEGKPIEELYALIGQPNSSDYVPSCLGGEGSEDGNLYYDGFIVYTLKDGDSETVVFAELG